MPANEPLKVRFMVNKNVISLLARECFDVLHTGCTSYSELVDRLSALDLKGKPRAAKKWWVENTGRISDCLRYAWHRAAVGGDTSLPPNIHFPDYTNRRERLLMITALRVGFQIGERHRHSPPKPTHG